MESSEAAKEPQTATDLMGELWEEEKGGVRVRDWRSRVKALVDFDVPWLLSISYCHINIL